MNCTRPYQRPMLSKAFLQKSHPQPNELYLHGNDWFTKQKVLNSAWGTFCHAV